MLLWWVLTVPSFLFVVIDIWRSTPESPLKWASRDSHRIHRAPWSVLLRTRLPRTASRRSRYRRGCQAAPDTTYLLTVGWVGVLMMWLSRSRTAPAGGVRPPTQMARSWRRRFNSWTGMARRRPTARSSATVSRLITAGPAPARTEARTAAADDNSSTGGACCILSPSSRCSAVVNESRVPEPSSRVTRGVCASSAALTTRDRRVHL